MANVGVLLAGAGLGGLFVPPSSAGSLTENVNEPARQSIESISAAAVDFVRTRHDDDASLLVDGGALDARLRLGRCATPLAARLAPGSRDVGRVTVQVACPSTPAWRVHVALRVSRERTLWTLARAVRRGEPLTPDLLERTAVTLGRGESLAARSGTPVGSTDAWLGHEFARDVSPGRLLLENMLIPRRLVERGASVRIRIGGAGLDVETAGVALADAARGERVTVRNDASGRLVEAIVSGRGTVEIPRGR